MIRLTLTEEEARWFLGFLGSHILALQCMGQKVTAERASKAWGKIKRALDRVGPARKGRT